MFLHISLGTNTTYLSFVLIIKGRVMIKAKAIISYTTEAPTWS